MKIPLRGSIRANLFLLILVAVLPLFLMIVVAGRDLREQGCKDVEADALRLADILAVQLEQNIHGVERMLFAMARIPALQNLDAAASTPLLRRIVGDNPAYVNMTLLDPQGVVVASALPFAKANFADMPHVAEVMRAKRFAVSAYLVGRISGVPVLSLAQPVLGPQDELLGILTTSLNLEYHKLFEETALPPGSVLALLDREGRRLLHYPPEPTKPLGEKILPDSWAMYSGGEASGVVPQVGADGLRRLYAYARRRLDSRPEASLYAVVAIPEAQALARADALTQRNLLWLLVATALSLFLAVLVGKWGIIGPLAKLTEDAKRLGTGDLDVKTGLSWLSGPIGALARTVDATAAAIRARTQERDAAEALWKQHAERIEAISRITTDFAYSCLGDGGATRLDWMSGAVTDITGYTADELFAQQCWRFLVVEQDLPLFDGNVLGLSPGQSGKCELRIRRKDGQEVWLRSFAECTADTTNPFGHRLFGGCQDITERKLAEEALKESEGLKNLLMHSIDAGIVVIDSHTHVIESVNQAAARMFGAPVEQIIGKECHHFLCPAEKGACPITDLGQDVERSDRILLQADGERVPILKSVKYIKIGGQDKLLETFVDIAERKRTEKALGELEQRYRELVEYAPIGIFHSTPEGRYLAANTWLARMYGYDSATELMENVKDIGLQLYADAAEREALKKTLVGGVVNRQEVRQRRRDGSVIWVSLSVRVVRNESGEIVLYEGFADDVTERKLAEEALRESEERYRTLAITDSLTGLYNRRHFWTQACKEFHGAARHARHVAIILLDIDHFKKVNDTHGHASGDRALQLVAGLLRGALRENDIPGRYGGEEFVVLLPDTDLTGASLVADRIRTNLSRENLVIEGEEIALTASFGVSAYKGCGRPDATCELLVEAAVKQADRALYQAKEMGRNLVVGFDGCR